MFEIIEQEAERKRKQAKKAAKAKRLAAERAAEQHANTQRLAWLSINAQLDTAPGPGGAAHGRSASL
jgi:hypothetical protein